MILKALINEAKTMISVKIKISIPKTGLETTGDLFMDSVVGADTIVKTSWALCTTWGILMSPMGWGWLRNLNKMPVGSGMIHDVRSNRKEKENHQGQTTKKNVPDIFFLNI